MGNGKNTDEPAVAKKKLMRKDTNQSITAVVHTCTMYHESFGLNTYFAIMQIFAQSGQLLHHILAKRNEWVLLTLNALFLIFQKPKPKTLNIKILVRNVLCLIRFSFLELENVNYLN